MKTVKFVVIVNVTLQNPTWLPRMTHQRPVMEPIHEPLHVADFRSYADYQSHTPESFSPASGPPILLHRAPNARLRLRQSDLEPASPLAPFVASANHLDPIASHEPTEVDEEEDVKEREVSGVDIWVASE